MAKKEKKFANGTKINPKSGIASIPTGLIPSSLSSGIPGRVRKVYNL